MDIMTDWQTWGVPTVVLIVALINVLKDTYGMDTKFAFPVATGLGAVEGAALYFGPHYPIVETINSIAVGALLLGLAATGYYSGVKAHIERNQ